MDDKRTSLVRNIEHGTGVRGNKYSLMDWSDDQYTILTDDKGSHEHILSHYVLPALHELEHVRETLGKGLLTDNF